MTDKGNSSEMPPCFDCATDPTGRLNEMFIEIGQKRRIALGGDPSQREVFRKLHGVAHGWLEMEADMPAGYAVGVFSKQRLPAWMRFSSDTSPTSPDLGSTVGIGLKLWGVEGENALREPGDVSDFIMQNYPVFFVDDAKSMCEFTYAGVVLGDYPTYLKHHPKTNHILKQMSAQVNGSVLTTQYWAILPFDFGPGYYAKYTLVPQPPFAAPEVNVPFEDADYMATDMYQRLVTGDYRFDFMVQRVPKSDNPPLDNATEEWSTDKYPYVKVATLVIPRQDICAEGQAAYGQELAFNIWRTPVEQTPQGSIAAVRKVVYNNGANLRHHASGQQLGQPAKPRRPVPPPPREDTCIVQAVIYPAIGVARIGNAPEGYVVGPEVIDPPPLMGSDDPANNPYRDAEGRLYPQAARFRIYGVNAKGVIVKELTGGDSGADIRWTSHLANQKSAWYTFQLALDIPEVSSADPTTLRNPTVSDRAALKLDAGPRTIHVGHGDQSHDLHGGQFMHQGPDVFLGRMWCEKDGRLMMIGGRGYSSSYNHSVAITFGNNEAWHDDTSDGPITAKVKYNGVELPVTPAWLVVAPPNYAPQRKSVRTMWDLMRDVAIKAGTLPKPKRPSFSNDIFPIFQRMSGLEWVNQGFYAAFGWNGPFNLIKDDAAIKKLNDPSPANQEFRRVIKNNFRHDTVDSWSPTPWPWVYGDAMNIPPAETPRQYTQLTDTQLEFLDQWVAGDFEADWGTVRGYPFIEYVPLERQGDMLTQAALEFCLADAFHPGCEMTWPVRASTMYMAPFRFAHAPKGWVEPGMGEILSPDTVTIPNGPLYGQMPGGITRWMAVPWQTDTGSCRSGYDKTYDPYVPTFWPARVPNEVLTREMYDIVMDTKKTKAERLAAFATRGAWVAPLGTESYTQQINNMIHHFDHLGVVEVFPGPTDDEMGLDLPTLVEVEDQHKPIKDVPLVTNTGHLRHLKAAHGAPHRAGGIGGADGGDGVDLSRIDKVRRFPRGLRR